MTMRLYTDKLADFATQYFLAHLLPNLLISFFIYGLYPVLCSKIGLVISAEDFKKNEPEVAKIFTQSFLVSSLVNSPTLKSRDVNSL